MRIVFMGTPDFAAPSLKCLVKSHDVAAIVTAADKPIGRGLKVRFSPIKNLALSLEIPVLQPVDLDDQKFLEDLSRFGPDLLVVVAFRILPLNIFELPKRGSINLHASLLPKYRGAAPINWAIINGEKESGVTTIFIKKEVDAGHIILQEKVAIGDSETAGELHDRLAHLGSELLSKTVNLIESNDAPSIEQIGEVTKAPKLTRQVCNILWTKQSRQICNLIRGLCPVPGAFTFLKGQLFKIYASESRVGTPRIDVPGEIDVGQARQGRLLVGTGSGALAITELQPAGKRRMPAHDFLLGHKIDPGDRFESA